MLIFLLLVHRSTNLNYASEDLIISIENPANGTIFEWRDIYLTYSVSITSNDNSNLNYLTHYLLTHELFCGGTLIYKRQNVDDLSFKSVLSYDLMGVGWNNITVLISSQTDHILASSSVLIYNPKRYLESKLSHILHSLKLDHAQNINLSLSPSFFLGGLGQEIISEFISVDANRVEILDIDTTSCTFSNTFKIVHQSCGPDAMFVPPAVVDYSFISFYGLIALFPEVSQLDNILTTLVRNTRKQLFLLAAKDVVECNAHIAFSPRYVSCRSHGAKNSQLMRSDIAPQSMERADETMSFFKDYRWEKLSFRKVGETGEDDEIAPGLSLWRLNAPYAIDRNSVNSRELKSELLHEDYSASQPHILLSNTCYRYDSREIITFYNKRDGNKPDVSSTPRSALVNVNYLAEDESRGFLYLGLNFIETDSNSELAQEAKSWPWVSGHSAVSMSVKPGHIVHDLEPLLPLLSLDELPESLASIDRILFPSRTSDLESDWSISMLSIMMNWLAYHRKANSPLIYLEGHLPVDKGGICFEQLTILGRVNTHTKFFRNAAVAFEFRKYVHNHIVQPFSLVNQSSDIRLHDIPLSYTANTSVACLRHSTSCPLFLHRVANNTTYQRLKVTIVLRSDKNQTRRIINLSRLQKLIVKSGLVDTSWMLQHTVYFDHMSFEAQVHIMASTDVLISVHGAALINGIFLKSGSVAIDVVNGPFSEYVFTVPLNDVGVRLLYVQQWNESKFRNCPNHKIPQKCFEGSRFDAGAIDCWHLRQCSVEVDERVW